MWFYVKKGITERPPREELWVIMKSGVTDKYVGWRTLCMMTVTVIRCTVEMMNRFRYVFEVVTLTKEKGEVKPEVATLKMLQFSLWVSRLDRIKKRVCHVASTTQWWRIGWDMTVTTSDESIRKEEWVLTEFYYSSFTDLCVFTYFIGHIGLLSLQVQARYHYPYIWREFY